MELLRVPLHEEYQLIKPLVGFRTDIEARLAKFPFERNVFVMMKFRPHNVALSDFIRETLAAHDFNGVRADDPAWNITNNVFNPIAVLYCCKFGLALFDEPEEGQAYSPNVAYELGILHLQGKECLILKHATLPDTPFDLIKDLHQPYTRELDVRPLITKWAAGLTPSTPSASPAAGNTRAAVPVSMSIPSVASFEGTDADEPLQVTDAAIRILGQNAAFWKFSWRMTVHSRLRGDTHILIFVKYLDSERFLLDEQEVRPAELVRSASTAQFSETFLLETSLAKRLKIVHVRAVPHVAF